MISLANWQKRNTVVLFSFFAVFICYIDRVNMSVAIIPMAEDLGWGMQMQGTILSSFFVGYLLLQIVGGRLADRFGGKLVLGVGVLAWSLFTILTPPAASIGLGLLLATRILMGMGEAVTFPSIYSLYAKWVPMTERSRAIGFTNSGIPFGTVFALIVTPYIVSIWGWQWAFYSFGLVGVVWWYFWHRMIRSAPTAQPPLGPSPQPLTTNEASSDPQSDEAIGPVPWRAMLSSTAVWAIIVAHFCNNWSLYVLLSWLPTFVNKGLGVDYATVGWFTMIPHVASFFCLNLAGSLADRLVRNGWRVIVVRKLFQTIGFGGIALSLAVVGYIPTAELAIAVMAAGSALGAFVTGGFAVNHMDIAPKYAGTLMGITNTAGTIPGIIGVFVSGLILELTGSWTLVFQVAAGVTLFGMVFYLVFAKAEKLFD
jgi:MFS family permease|tara:strand:- start:285 stop:1562 length:1278 start_codon:yes stop_codon:yes gene_type:complete